MTSEVCVRRFNDYVEARIAQSYLESRGLSSRVPELETLGVLPYWFAAQDGYRLLVPEHDAEDARRLLDEVDRPTDAAGFGDLVCPECGDADLRPEKSMMSALLAAFLGDNASPRLRCNACGLLWEKSNETARPQ